VVVCPSAFSGWATESSAGVFQWAYSYLTFSRADRLIYGTFHPRKGPVGATSETVDSNHRGATTAN
jgi:hypothetical protein